MSLAHAYQIILAGGDTKPPSGNFRLQHWPPLETEPFCLPSLADLYISLWSDATGLLQLEHTILSLMLSTSAAWHPQNNDLFFGQSATGPLMLRHAINECVHVSKDWHT